MFRWSPSLGTQWGPSGRWEGCVPGWVRGVLGLSHLHRKANGSHRIGVAEVGNTGLLYPLSAMSKGPSIYENITDL